VPLVSAIAAGNCAIVKPSELAPASAALIKNIINEYLDPQCFVAMTGDIQVASALLDRPFDHIFFTGSTNIGQEVMKKAARYLTPITLEMGGKSPSIIDDSADLGLAAKRIIWGKCLNAGQTCIAPDYVLISKHLVNDFVRLAKTNLDAMLGDNKRMAESYGRIINERHFLRLVNFLSDGRIAHGGVHDPKERFMEPTILVDVKPESSVMREEIFGPILPVIGVKNLNAAMDFVNERPHPLVLYIFSRKKSVIANVLDRCPSGGVAINDCVTQAGIIDLPFGGLGPSGMGAYHGIYGFETFSHLRAVHKRANILDNPLKYPPYTEKKLSLARLLL
jgi:aldehyde dehydrogenase (NAD+)